MTSSRAPLVLAIIALVLTPILPPISLMLLACAAGLRQDYKHHAKRYRHEVRWTAQYVWAGRLIVAGFALATLLLVGYLIWPSLYPLF